MIKPRFRQQSIYIKDEHSSALADYMAKHELETVRAAITHILERFLDHEPVEPYPTKPIDNDEHWKPLKQGGEVSSHGRVRGVRGGIRSPQLVAGYYYLGIGKKNYPIHRLVADAFIPNPEGHPVVNHIDGDKTNNRVDNLEWTTQSNNVLHGIHLKRQRNQ